MRGLLFVVCSLILTNLKASTFYISATSGADSRTSFQAQNPNTPWQTLSKVNSVTFAPGDSILFKRGDVFYGGLIVNQSGTSTNPVVYGAYGTGEKPVITGFTTVGNWANTRGNIYEFNNPSYPQNVNMVLVDGAFQAIGRYPKAKSSNGGWLTNQSHLDHSSLTSNQIANLPSFAGGEIVMKKYQYLLDKGRVTSQTSSTVTIDHYVAPNHPSAFYEIMDNHGFFFQNHINTLTQPKEWCYDNGSKKLMMYAPGFSIVQASTIENLVTLTAKNYIHFSDISFTGANSFAFYLDDGSGNISITNCNISFTGINAIQVGSFSIGSVIVDGCNISYTNNNAIEGKSSKNWLIQNNTITNTGMIEGMGCPGDGQYNAISYTGDGSLIQYNKIINTGYIGIHFTGNNTTIKNNYIDSFVMIKSDGGGIYTYGETTKTNRLVTGNIILNGPGNLYGANEDTLNPYGGQVHGIYMDGGTGNVTITNNTVANCSHSGIWLSSPKGILATGNTLYNNTVAQIKVSENVDKISNLILKNNVLFATDSAKLVGSFLLNQTALASIGTIDSNYYSRALYEPTGVSTGGYPHVPTFYNYPGGGIIEAPDNRFYSLDTWQSLSNQDIHSSKSPVTVSSLGKIRFEYNASNSSKTINLNGSYVDVKNQLYKNSVTLPPYSSIVLINTPTALSFNWNGSSSTDWNTSSNWDNNTVPTATSPAYIPSTAANMPVIFSGSASVNNITIEKGASLTISKEAVLNVAGALENNSTIQGDGKIVLNGSSTQSVSGNGTINNFEVNNAAGVNVLTDSKIDVTGVLTLTSGLFNTSNNLTLKSSSVNTARIAPVTRGGITGDVTVEHYIPSKKGYRFLAPSVNTTSSIKSNWQEGVNNVNRINNNNPNPGYGTHITGSVTGSDGFDATVTGSPSLFTYAQSKPIPGWTNIANTNVSTFDAKKGYLLYIRGSRSTNINDNSSSVTSTILRATGSLVTGTVDFANQEGNGRVSVIGNPYASPISWESVYAANSSNFEKFYTLWDPNVGTRGGFVTVDVTGSTSVLKSGATTEIQSGQAFMVKAKTGSIAPTFTVKETDKSTTNNISVFRTNNSTPSFYTSLYFTDTSGSRKLADGALARFDISYSPTVDQDDATDVANFDENIAFVRDGAKLSIESRPSINGADTLFLSMDNVKQQTYEWQFDPTNFNASTVKQAYLRDKYTGTENVITLAAPTVFAFTVTSDVASAAADRFSIVFKSLETLPVKIISLDAHEVNGGINVAWKTTAEVNISKYVVEKSMDGVSFTLAGSENAKGSVSSISDYNWFDTVVHKGYNYYRIKSLNRDGRFEYSGVVRVLIKATTNASTATQSSVNVYPNPLRGNVFNLQLTNVEKGNYVLEILNASGQTVYRQNVANNSDVTTQAVSITNNLTAGMYSIKLSSKSEVLSKQIIKQ
jgi:hypothetical protein